MENNTVVTEITNVTIRQVNRNTNNVINSDTLTCNGTNILKVTINYLHNTNAFLKKAFIKLALLSHGDLNFKICMITQYENGVISYGEPISHCELLTENNVDYVIFDISNLLMYSDSSNFDLAITPSSGSPTMQIYGNLSDIHQPKLILHKILFSEITDRMPTISNSLSNFVNYRMNILHAHYRFNIPLINLNLGDVPLNLNLVYTENYMVNNNLNYWMFSYNQYVYHVDSKTYHYIDSSGDKHIFEKTNKENVYHDNINRYLFLKVEDNKFIITDEKRNELEFDSNGRLTKIKYKKSDNTTKYTLITRDSDGKITRVEDDLFRICDFLYYENKIVVRYANLREINIFLDNGFVTSISGLVTDQTKLLEVTNLIKIQNDNTNITTNLIEAIKTPNQEKVVFDYYETGVLSKITLFNNNEKLLTNEIKRTENQISILNYEYQYEDVSSINYIDFNEFGSVVKTFDDVFGTILNVQTYPNDKNIRSEKSIHNNLLRYITFDDDLNFIDYIFIDRFNSSVSYNLNEITLNTLKDNEGQTYNLEVTYYLDSVVNYYKHNDSYIELQLELVNDNTIANETCRIDEYKEGQLTEPIKFNINLPLCENLIIRGKILFYNFSGTIKFNPIVLYQEIKTMNYDCLNYETNLEFGNPKKIDIENESWYTLTNANILYSFYDGEIYSKIDDVVMNINDYFMTLQSYYNKGSNGYFNVYYNDGDCLLDIKKLKIEYGTNRIYNISDCKISTITKYVNKTQVIEYDFLSSKQYKITNKVIYNNGKKEFIEKTYDYYDNLLIEKDQFNLTKNNSYLPNGELSETIIYNSSSGLDSLQMITAYDKYYTSDKYVVTTYEILCLTQIQEAATTNIVRSDISTGNVSSVILPNDHIINYSYNINEGYLNEINTTVDNKINKNSISKTGNYLESYNHNNITYQFNYDNKGYLENVSYGNNDLVYYYYNHTINEKMIRTNFINESYYDETYDKFNRLIKLEDVDFGTISYTYSSKLVDELDTDQTTIANPNDKLRKVEIGDKTTKYYYDLHDYSTNYDYSSAEKYDNIYGNLTKEVNTDYTSTYGYDSLNRIKCTNLIQSINNNVEISNSTTYNYSDTEIYRNDNISKIYLGTNIKYNSGLDETYDYTLDYDFDYLNRMTKTSLKRGIDLSGVEKFEKEYSYCSGTYLTSNYINTVNYKLNDELFDKEEITYNNLKCISSIKYNNDDNKTINYIYDNIGRLIKEENKILNIITVYEYDYGGNIISKKSCPYTTSNTLVYDDVYEFEYDITFKDKLINIKHNDGPVNIVRYDNYDLLPSLCLKYDYSWGSQNRLTRVENRDMDSFITSNYSYYPTGLRKEKEITYQDTPTHKHEYIYKNDTLICETVKEQQDGSTAFIDKYKLCFTNDGSNITGFYYYHNNHNSSDYYIYVRDILGNIKYILDYNLYPVCKYEYDAWGNHKVYRYENDIFVEDTSSSFIGNINPIRYKGYYYDVETKAYYCNSRYYSPELCRWISPDSIKYLSPESINGLNLYCYCFDNPVMYKDTMGFFPEPIRILGDLISGFSESMGKPIWKHALKYLNFSKKYKLSLAKKLIKKNGLKKGALDVVDEYTDDALTNYKFGKGLEKFGNILGTVLTVIDIGSIIYNNYSSGSETWFSESVVDIAYIGLQSGISALCIAYIPGVGWLVAIGANLLLDYIAEETGFVDNIKAWASQYDNEIREIIFGRGILLGI